MSGSEAPSTIHLHTRFRLAPVDPLLYGGFIEHMGRAVYGGLYDPGSAHADGHGFRGDVLRALEKLRLTQFRYPGGNFVSGYHWRDGVGPIGERPTRIDKAWHSEEPNTIGTDEILGLCERMGWRPMLAVNLGTAGAEAAAAWVEYCNGPPSSPNGALRAAHGHPAPYDVGLWCLGNEIDGPWQLGHTTAAEYVERAMGAAQAMRAVDPRIRLIACGSSHPELATYLSWDQTVIEALTGVADYISLHRYASRSVRINDLSELYGTEDYLAFSLSLDSQIEAVDAMCRGVAARRRLPRLYLAADEWNVWYRTVGPEHLYGDNRLAPPLAEERYNLEDALVVGTFLNSFLRHADSVKLANLAQLVNAIAPLITVGDRLLVQSTYHAFAMFAKRQGAVALRTALDGPSYTSRFGEAPRVDHSAVLDGDHLHVFLVNRNLQRTEQVVVRLADRAFSALSSAEVLTGPDPAAENTLEQPDLVAARPFDAVQLGDHVATIWLPPLSLLACTFVLDGP